MANISIDYIRNLLSRKLDDEVNYFKERKDQAEFLNSEIRFFCALCMIVLHICLRQDSDLFERIAVVVLSFVISAKISTSFFERKMEEITSHWDDFHNVMIGINPILDKESVSETEAHDIENDIKEVTARSNTKTFIKSYFFEVLTHIFCLSTGLLFFFYLLDSSLLNTIYSLLLAYFTSRTILYMRDMYTL